VIRVADTSALYPVFDGDDAHHAQAREDLADPAPVVVPSEILVETINLIEYRFGFSPASTALERLLAKPHVSVADPFCADLSSDLAQSVESVDGVVHHGGSYVTIEGPRFSTRAESNTYRSWGMSIVGMTTSPEAFLACEAEMCYAVLAHVTDYDVWRTAEEPVTVELVMSVVNQNTELARRALSDLLPDLPVDGDCDCSQALRAALTTDPDHINPTARERLSLLVGDYLT
jgi:5'-methylthioadenosine phosphorylase